MTFGFASPARRHASLNVVRFTLVALGSAGALVGVGSACLPELGPLPLADAGVVERPELTGCGDGIIATNDDGSDAGESCDPGGDPAVGCSSTCTIECPGVIGPSGHCYFIAEPSDYQRAVTNCSAAGGHVVTIGGEGEAALVRSLVGTARYRVGLLLDENLSLVAYKTPPLVEEPGWPHEQPSCPGCFAKGADDAGQFAPLVADAGPRPNCLAADVDDRWVQVACNRSDPDILTVCEREPVGQRSQPCGGPLCTTLASTAGKKRYVISISPATAEEADQLCRGYEGGSLVVFESREEREELAREIRALVPASQQHPVLTIWLGLEKSGDVWRWADGLDVSAAPRPLPWANAQPAPSSTGRAFMRLDVNAFDPQLAATGDDEPRLFVCQRAP